MKNITARSVLLAVLLVSLLESVAIAAPDNASILHLRRGWTLQSSRNVAVAGDIISTPKFQARDWYSISVPATVLAAQVASGEFKEDLYVGTNLRKVPGMTYPIGLNSFSNLPMDPASPYAVSWWYRKTFDLPRSFAGHRVSIHFKGINYRANVWLNGRRVADSRDVAGAYKVHEFDVTSFVTGDKTNVLAVEVFAPTEKQLGINWVDWNPTPPDKDMGIWGDVYLTASGPVVVRYPAVTTHFTDASLKEAELTVIAELHNRSDKAVRGVLEAVVDRTTIRQEITLQANESRSVAFAPEDYPALRIGDPKLWWPSGMGAPMLHPLAVRFLIGGKVSDETRTRFGIREVTSELTDKNHRLFRVNGKPILIRGGGWAQDMLLRRSPKRLEAQLQYVRAMGLNTIRLEAQLEPDEFFDRADELGLLVIAGWCCCDIWEKWDEWPAGTLDVATASLRAQSLRLRSHPSLLAWLNGSDGPPPANVETAYLNVLKETGWQNPVLSSASDTPTKVTGPSGVKMTGPYDYEPPSYWLTDKTKWGGAWGFNTETSPGPAVPVFESIHKMISKDHLWPIDEVWNYHSAGERFQTMDRYNEAMDKTYGSPTSLEDYLKKSQAMAYDGQRAMFEAYARNKYVSTGVIQWMMNNAWPSLYWHLFDYYLHPGGGYFGTKKACEPLHIQYSYDDRSVVIVNNHQQRFSGLTASAKVFDAGMKQIFAREVRTDVNADAVRRVLNVPEFSPDSSSAVFFVKLALHDRSGREVSSNFYWLPSKLSTLDWDKTPDTAYTPIATFEDLTALNRLPRVRLSADARVLSHTSPGVVEVTLHNPSNNLAFQIHLGIASSKQADEILPVLWDDNYISLLPGESRIVKVRYLESNVIGAKAVLRVDGWNIEPIATPLARDRTQAEQVKH